MQLTNIQIQNFRSIQSMKLDPKKITVFTGANGSGKSSTLEAIRFVLTGKAAPFSVKNGETAAIVSCEALGSTLERKCGSKTSVKLDGKTTTQKSVQKWLEDSASITTDTIRVATSAGILASMSGDELTSYLINNELIPASIDFDMFKTLYPLSPPAEEELSMMLPAAPVKFGMEEIQNAYSHYFAARPILRKQLQEKQTLAQYLETVYVPPRTLDSIDKEMGKYASYKSEMNAYDRLMRIYQDAFRRREQLQKEISELDTQISRMSSAKAVDPNELKFLRTQEKKHQEDISSLEKTRQTLIANIRMFQRTLENLDRPVCPISEKLVCTTDKTQIRTELTELAERNNTELKKTETAISKTNGALQSVRKKIDDYNDRDQAYRQRTVLHERRTAKFNALPIIPEKPVRPAEIPDAELQIAALKAEREAIFRYNAAVKAQKEIEPIQAQLQIYDELIKALSPKGGVREMIIEAVFDPLIEHCNMRAEKLRPGFKISLKADGGVHILCAPNEDSGMLPLSAVSSGQQVFAMLLMMDAINALSQLGLLMLDDLDKLDAEALSALFELLADPEVTEPYDHIFLAMVNHDDSMKLLKKYGHVVDCHIDMSAA